MNNLTVIEHQNQRILTTQQLAESYGTNTDIINQNYSRNNQRYIQGKHFFLLEGIELKEFKATLQNEGNLSDEIKFAPKLQLWTEKGAWLHAKSLGTDEAWNAYEMLVDEYYRIKDKQLQIPQTFAEALRLAADLAEEKEKLQQQNALMVPKAEFFDAVADSKDAIAIGEAAKVLNMGIGRNRLFEFLRKKKVLMRDNLPYQEYIDRGYFRTIEQKYQTPEGETKISIKTLVYQKGLDFIRRLLNEGQQVVIR